MRITITQKNGVCSDSVKERIEKKLGKLDKFFKDEVTAQVRLSQERGGREIVEVTINMDGVMLRVEEVSNDMYASIDRAADKLERQIRRHKTKLAKRLHTIALEEDETQEPVPEDESRLVRVKRFTLKPMSVEDAIAQMDLLGHSFFLFINDATGGTCVVYRRLDGDIGMLEPENT